MTVSSLYIYWTVYHYFRVYCYLNILFKLTVKQPQAGPSGGIPERVIITDVIHVCYCL